MDSEVRVSSKSLTEFIHKLYAKAGMAPEEAEYHAKALVLSSLRGVDSHGVMRTNAYLMRIENGAINVHPQMKYEKARGAVWELNADSASGYTAGRIAMEKAIELAEQYSLGMVLVKNSNHFGAAAMYADMAVKRGMMGFATTNVKPGMTAPGASGNVVGNNPFAIGFPTYCDFPFMLDMALSVVAGGKLKMAIARGEKIPLTWATDKNGNPTDDPQAGFDGYFLPLGGFKGLGMAYAIDILCGVMSGGAFQNHIKNMFKDPTDPSRTCHMFMALDLTKLIGKEEIRSRMTEYRDYVRNIPTLSGTPLVMPGEPEENCRKERMDKGIPLPESLAQEFQQLSRTYGVPLEI